MPEHLSQLQLERYGYRTLEPDELLAVDRHLAACDLCHERLVRISPAVANQRSLDQWSSLEPFHLDYDQHLVAYVDGNLDEIDREIVESHLAQCSQCAEDLYDLQEFAREPVAPPSEATRTVRVPAWKRWMGQWSSHGLLNPHLVRAVAIALFILGITVVVLMWATNRTSLPVEQAAHPSPSPIDIPGSASPKPTEPTIAIQPSPQRDQPNARREEPLVALNDGGGQVTLDQQGHLRGMENLPPELRSAVETALTNGRVDVSPALANLAESTGRLRGGVETQDVIVPLEPTGIVIESDRPTFRWRPLEGAGDYVVTIYDAKLRNVEKSGPIAGAEWTTSRPLELGMTYSWQISAVKDGKTIISPKPPAPEARFRVLDRNSIASLENARRFNGNSHLAMGVAYSKHGLIDQAEREFEALVRANPESKVAAELLRSLRSVRRR